METYEIIDRLSASLEEVEDRDFSGSEITEYCIQFCSHPDLKEYDLSRQDCIITAHIWQSTVKDSGCDKALDLLKLFYDETHLQIKNLDIVISLVNRNVLFIPDLSIKCSAGFYERKDIPALKKADIIDERVDMHPDFLRLLLGEKTSESSAKTMHYKDNNEFLDDWINYVTMIDDLKTGRHSTFFDGDEMDQDDIQNLINIDKTKDQIYKRMHLTKHKFPLIEMIDQYQLDHKDVLILIYLLKQKLEDKSCDSDDVMKLISSNHLELFSNRKYLNKSSRLVKNNLISVSEERAFMATSIVVSITNSALRRILMSKALSDEEKLAQILDDMIYSL